ncbi:MAG: TIR domain-containing protein [Leptolyngbya sp. LCM1.Bin17]|nr:MAG: TIR domain-containing protein [Leptolyngbya sp. LCM1.Bin17]
MAGEALDVFISYSHRDEGLKDELVNYHLKPLQRQGKINTWEDRQIEAGAEWAREIKTNLEKADIVLLLITRHFLASDYCYEIEMQRAVQRHHEGTARVIPIILETCGWQYSPFRQLQVLPKDGKPVNRWQDRAEAFFYVEEGIRRVVDALNAERQEAAAAQSRQAEELKRQQEEAARLERARQERERLAAEQRQREQAEAQRKEQERLEQARLAAEQRQREAEVQRVDQERQQQELQKIEQDRQEQDVQKRQDTRLNQQAHPLEQTAENKQDKALSSATDVKSVDAKDEPSESVEQNPLLTRITLWEIPLNRRSTLGWLAAAIGGGGLLVWGATSGNGASPPNPTPSGESPPPSSPGRGQESDNPPATTPPPESFGKGLKLQSFSFPVVSLNAQGKEISRVQKQNKYFVEDLGQGIGLDMVAIPGGRFLMGSPDGDGYANEKPQHQVTLNPFYLGKFAVTQAQWQAVAALPTVARQLKPDPSRFTGAMRPVEQVSWDDAVEFCQRLSRYTKRDYRLPSEAEWEYACRAGTTTPFHFGPVISREFVNCKRNLGMVIVGLFAGETTEVGSYQVANAFGLYDMHGNVLEWCQDVWHENYEGAPTDGSAWIEDRVQSRLLRGGSWSLYPRVCRSASRYGGVRVYGDNDFGFRVVCASSG